MLNVVTFVLLGALLCFSTVNADSRGCVTTDCKNGECIMDDPRYPLGYCQCHWGYKKSELDNTVCVDRDECAMADRMVCGGGLCRNTMGGYYCDCFRGYWPTFFRTYCQPIFPPAKSSMGEMMLKFAIMRRLFE